MSGLVQFSAEHVLLELGVFGKSATHLVVKLVRIDALTVDRFEAVHRDAAA
jgi:hypothetical protein